MPDARLRCQMPDARLGGAWNRDRHNPMSVGTIYPDFLRVSSRCLDTVLIPERFFGGIAGAFNLSNQILCSFLDCVTEADSDPPAKTPKKHCI
jgi:hypothetical protein